MVGTSRLHHGTRATGLPRLMETHGAQLLAVGSGWDERKVGCASAVGFCSLGRTHA